MTAMIEVRRQEGAETKRIAEPLLRDALPGCRWDAPDGARSLWIRLPCSDARELLAVARHHGVHCAPGRAFSRQADDAACIRVMYVQPEADLRSGIARLARAWREYSAS